MLILLVWVTFVGAGMGLLLSYAFKGEIPHATAATWPSATQIEVSPAKPMLLLFLHPHCPCTAASIAELDRVLSDYPDAFHVYAVLSLPEAEAEGWQDTVNVRAVKRLPGASIHPDSAGTLSAKFGSHVSGTVLVYGNTGRRLFSGGLTASRGHEGESAGTLALRAIAAGKSPVQPSSPVFGCALVSPEAEAREDAL